MRKWKQEPVQCFTDECEEMQSRRSDYCPSCVNKRKIEKDASVRREKKARRKFMMQCLPMTPGKRIVESIIGLGCNA
jgi:hypothetical protein